MKSATHSLRLTLRWTVLLAGTLLSACVGGQTGGEDAVPPEPESPPPSLPFPGGAASRACQDETTPTVLASADETSPAGFSAASVLRYAEGTFNEPLVFDRRSADDRFDARTPLTIEPGGDEPLEVEIRYAEGELRYFAPDVDGSLPGWPCRGRLEIDVQVSLRTPSGAIDESVDGVLVASSASEAWLWLRFHTAAVELARQPAHLDLPVVPVHRLAGDLTVTAMNNRGRHQLAFVELWLTLSELGVNGYLDGWIYGVDDAHVRMLTPHLATMGATCNDDGYGFPLGPEDQPVPGEVVPSARDVLALLAEMQIDAVRDDGSPLPFSLDLEYTADSACGRPGDITPLTFEAVLAITADLGEGRIDGRWPVELHTRSGSDGALASVTLTLAGDVSIESLENDWGVTGLQLAAYDDVSITFDLRIEPATDPPVVTGELFIRGYVLPEDMSRPVATEDGDVLGHLSFEAAPLL